MDSLKRPSSASSTGSNPKRLKTKAQTVVTPDDAGHTESKRETGTTEESSMEDLSRAIKRVEEESSPRTITVKKLVSLLVEFKNFPHEIPLLILLESVSKAFMLQDVESVYLEIIDCYERREHTRYEPFGLSMPTSNKWMSKTLVMDLPAINENDKAKHATNEEIAVLINAMTVFVQTQDRQCRSKSTLSGCRLFQVAEMNQVLGILDRKSDPTIMDMLPWMEVARRSRGVNYGAAKGEEKAIYDRLCEAVDKWALRHPVINRYLDPPNVISFPLPTAPLVGLAAINGNIPPARFAPAPVWGVTGAAVTGVTELAGNGLDARWYGDLLRTHYGDGAGGGGALAGHVIVSFNTTAGHPLQFH